MDPLVKVVRGGDLEGVERFCDEQVEDYTDTVAHWAAHWGQIRLLEWCCTQPGYTPTDALLVMAALCGHLDVLVWLQQKVGLTARNPWLCTQAASRGDVAMLAWLLQADCVYDKHAYEAAAGTGGLAALQELPTQRDTCPWTVPERFKFCDKRTRFWAFTHLPLSAEAREEATRLVSEMTQAHLVLTYAMPEKVPSVAIRDIVAHAFT